jgi:hypothetical protein
MSFSALLRASAILRLHHVFGWSCPSVWIQGRQLPQERKKRSSHKEHKVHKGAWPSACSSLCLLCPLCPLWPICSCLLWQKKIGMREQRQGGVRSASTGCFPGAPEPRFLGRNQAPPGALPAKPEAAFGGPVRGGPKSLRVFESSWWIFLFI